MAEGEKIGQMIGARFVRYDENGQTIVLDIDGNETTEQSIGNYVVVGNGLPDFELGINQNGSVASNVIKNRILYIYNKKDVQRPLFPQINHSTSCLFQIKI